MSGVSTVGSLSGCNQKMAPGRLGDFGDNASMKIIAFSLVYKDPLINETMTFDGMSLVFVMLKSSLSGSCHLISI